MPMPLSDLLILNPSDNVGVVVVEGPIKIGHKVALRALSAGAPVIKFGHVIGVATREIAAGEHVHTHNLRMPSAEQILGDHTNDETAATGGLRWTGLPTTFRGYARADGSVGVRNYVLVVASVNCSATVVKAVCRQFLGRDLSARGIDGVVPVCNAAGCAQAIGGEYHGLLNRTLAGWVFHPNVVGAVIIGLGCEGTTHRSILHAKETMGLVRDIPLDAFSIQQVGGTAQAIAAGVERVERLVEDLPVFERQTLPVSHLGIALNCGGSDAFSSLTANPALGLTSDMLVANGAMVALAEIPECHGAEDLLYRRAASPTVRENLDRVFAWWRDYATRQNVSLNDNLAPGNLEGGISTIVEKSLGAVTKGGTSPLTQVVDYAEPITAKGFTLMNTPGFDPVSVTGLVAGGCQLVAFTTGRGSVYGCAIAPTVKIATRTALFDRMRGDMDVDAGRVLSSGSTAPVAEDIYRLLVDVASGRKTCSETLGLGWEEFSPWPVGETL
ncbi:MAG: altronate dehydratase family protein [Acidobacteriota bacterium]